MKTKIIIEDYVRHENGEYFFSQQNLHFAKSEDGVPFPVIIGEEDPNEGFSFWYEKPYLVYVNNPHIKADEMSLSQLNNNRKLRILQLQFVVKNDESFYGKNYVYF